MTPPRTFAASSGALTKTLWIALAFALGGGFLAFKTASFVDNPLGSLVGPRGVRLVGFVALGLGAAVALFVAVRLATRRPALVVDDHGMALDAPSAPLGRLAWREVLQIGTLEVMGQRFLVVVPTEVERRLAALPALKRHLAQLNQRSFGTPFTVPESLLGARLEEVTAEIGRRAPHLAMR